MKDTHTSSHGLTLWHTTKQYTSSTVILLKVNEHSHLTDNSVVTHNIKQKDLGPDVPT